MTDCLLITNLLRSVRASAAHFSSQQQRATTVRKTPPNVAQPQSKTVRGENGRGKVGIRETSAKRTSDVKSVDDVDAAINEEPLILPEILSDFKAQLCNLQDEMRNDYAEIERLKVENEELQKKLESRDALIDALRSQLEARGGGAGAEKAQRTN